MLLKKSLLQRGTSFDSLDWEEIGGSRHDGHLSDASTLAGNAAAINDPYVSAAGYGGALHAETIELANSAIIGNDAGDSGGQLPRRPA